MALGFFIILFLCIKKNGVRRRMFGSHKDPERDGRSWCGSQPALRPWVDLLPLNLRFPNSNLKSVGQEFFQPGCAELQSSSNYRVVRSGEQSKNLKATGPDSL